MGAAPLLQLAMAAENSKALQKLGADAVKRASPTLGGLLDGLKRK
jgi:hypothetical protein